MKKIISIFLSVLMIASVSVAAFAEKELFDSLFDKLAEYTSAERASLIAYARPFVTSDTGVDAAISNIDSGAMDSMLGGMLGDVDNETLKRVFRSLTCIKDETELRIEYADIFQDKIELEGASSATISGVNKLLSALYDRSPAAEKIFEEDGITAGVIANMLTIIPKINGEKELVEYTNDGFLVYSIDETFESDFDAVWEGYVSESGKTITYESVIENFVDYLNQGVPQADHKSVAKALESLDVCKYSATTESGTGMGTGTGTGTGTNTKTEDYEILSSYTGITDEMLGGGVIIKTSKAAKVIEIETKLENPMLYSVSGNKLVPVTYSLPSKRGMKAVVDAESVYVVKSAGYPFTDASGWGKTYISALYNRGIVSGRTESTFEPDASITREEFVKLIVELFDLSEPNETVAFTDVAEGAWYYPYVAGAYKHNIVSGIGGGLFGTGQKIKRQDMAKIICSVLETKGVAMDYSLTDTFNDSASISGYAKQFVLAAKDLGIISGDDSGNFNPNNFATRQEAAKMIYGMLSVYMDTLGE